MIIFGDWLCVCIWGSWFVLRGCMVVLILLGWIIVCSKFGLLGG